jgi:isoquinoline 1-oxidoreductase alpha subunit
MSIRLRVNGTEHVLDIDPEMPLLWAVRDVLGLTGTKYGCGQALCGACSIHIDGEVVRACVTPVRRADGKAVTTIEGLSAALLAKRPKPTDQEIDESMGGNICRCGTYIRIRSAIKQAAGVPGDER